MPYLGTEDGMSLPQGGAEIWALEVRLERVAVFAPRGRSKAPSPLGTFPWGDPGRVWGAGEHVWPSLEAGPLGQISF